MVQHKYQEYSTGSLARQSASRLNALASTPKQEFEIDGEGDLTAASYTEEDNVSIEPSTKVRLYQLRYCHSVIALYHSRIMIIIPAS